MKKLSLLILVVILFSCSKDNNGCNCDYVEVIIKTNHGNSVIFSRDTIKFKKIQSSDCSSSKRTHLTKEKEDTLIYNYELKDCSNGKFITPEPFQ